MCVCLLLVYVCVSVFVNVRVCVREKDSVCMLIVGVCVKRLNEGETFESRMTNQSECTPCASISTWQNFHLQTTRREKFVRILRHVV